MSNLDQLHDVPRRSLTSRFFRRAMAHRALLLRLSAERPAIKSRKIMNYDPFSISGISALESISGFSVLVLESSSCTAVVISNEFLLIFGSAGSFLGVRVYPALWQPCLYAFISPE